MASRRCCARRRGRASSRAVSRAWSAPSAGRAGTAWSRRTRSGPTRSTHDDESPLHTQTYRFSEDERAFFSTIFLRLIRYLTHSADYASVFSSFSAGLVLSSLASAVGGSSLLSVLLLGFDLDARVVVCKGKTLLVILFDIYFFLLSILREAERNLPWERLKAVNSPPLVFKVLRIDPLPTSENYYITHQY